MSTVAKQTYLTPEEYLAAERLAEFKSEYYDGQVYGMAGTSYRHTMISGNLFGILYPQLRGGPCRPMASELRLRTKASSSYMYPDIMVICGPPQFADGVFDTVLNPTVIIEVLSPSTELWDRSGKFERYQSIETLQEYVLVSQQRMLVEKYSRQGDEWIFKSWKAAEDVLPLNSIDSRLELSEIYNGVPFEPEPN